MTKDILVIINYPLMEQIKKGNIDILQALFDALASKFDTVHVMSLKDTNNTRVYDFGARVKVYPVRPAIKRPWVMKHTLSLKRELQLARKIIKENPVVAVRALALLPSGYIATKVAGEAKIPAVLSLHEDRKFNEREQGRKNPLSPVLDKLESSVAKRASLFLVINKFIKKRALQLGVPNTKIRFHWNFAAKGFSQGTLPKKPRFLFVGRLEAVKRVDVLLRAFKHVLKKLPDAQFVIVGDGSMRNSLEDLAKSSGIDHAVKFLGSMPHEKLPALMHKCSVLIVVTGGFTIIEAFASGLPVVAAKAEWSDEVVVDGKTGYLVTTRDPHDFANAMLKLVKDRKKLNSMAKKLQTSC